ncbi:hypothetical protein GIB67_039740 [Kingdonia uniflora]|uniref:NB-ARC domain-containing protein n=1 Tax=Kingdonia uniflora TaxID=39325 RepID=A0A7J7MPX1_9MAGN|nr:hypothetical protein GIB67_039740 [Kingdonia uniflora]
MSIDELQASIHTYLQDKMYVLILDDIWDVKVWEEIKHALPPRRRGNIIFTARNEKRSFTYGRNVYKLKRLSHELAWDLFCRKAFTTTHPLGCCP